MNLIRIEKGIGNFFRGLSYISGASLLFMMMVTITDVFLRYVFNSPLGSNVDLTQMAMVVIVFFALAYCGWTAGHVVVDILTDVLPKSLLKVFDVLLNFIGGVLVLGIAWQSFLAAIDYAETGEVSFTLLVPLYPFLVVCAFGSLGYAVVLFYLTVRPNAGKGNS